MNKKTPPISETQASCTIWHWDGSLLLSQVSWLLWNRKWELPCHFPGDREVQESRLSCLGKDACYRFVHTVLVGDEWGCCCYFVFIWYIDISTVVKDKDFSPFGSAVLFLASLVWSCSQPAHSRRLLPRLCQRRWRDGLEEIGFEHWVKNTNKYINVRNL